MNVHDITKELELKIADYTGAPYCVCVDNESNALFMALTYVGVTGQKVFVPSHTYPSVPCEVINAGGRVQFYDSPSELTGEYQLRPFPVWDSALTFTADMYRAGQYQCLSFTGQWKRLKTVKGGAILTDNESAYKWLKRFRFSGRRECDYFADSFDFIGRNFYMPHVLAAIGLMNMSSFYNLDGSKKSFDDLTLPYPDLSKFKIYTQCLK